MNNTSQKLDYRYGYLPVFLYMNPLSIENQETPNDSISFKDCLKEAKNQKNNIRKVDFK